jgi:hypothetical protein
MKETQIQSQVLGHKDWASVQNRQFIFIFYVSTALQYCIKRPKPELYLLPNTMVTQPHLLPIPKIKEKKIVG